MRYNDTLTLSTESRRCSRFWGTERASTCLLGRSTARNAVTVSQDNVPESQPRHCAFPSSHSHHTTPECTLVAGYLVSRSSVRERSGDTADLTRTLSPYYNCREFFFKFSFIDIHSLQQIGDGGAKRTTGAKLNFRIIFGSGCDVKLDGKS